MNAAQLDLARALVALPGRWLPGMLDTRGRRVCTADGADIAGGYEGTPAVWDETPSDMGLPDITNPATVGCLLAMLEEKTAFVMHSLTAEGGDVSIQTVSNVPSRSGLHVGATLGEAVARALLAVGRCS